MLTEIKTAASEDQLKIINLSSPKTKKTERNNLFSLDLTIQGLIKSILHFIYTIENHPYLYSVAELQIEQSAPGTAELQCHLLITKSLLP